MAAIETPAQMTHSIGAVERDTGLPKDTLRVWERRYGFPHPGRDANGERVFPLEQVQKLRLIKRLLDRGHRPRKIIPLDIAELQRLSDGIADVAQGKDDHAERGDLLEYVELCKTHELEELRRTLAQALVRMGLQHFVLDVIAPLSAIVGDYWAKGLLAVYEEHLYTEAVQNVMRNAISSIPQQQHAKAYPRILLTTFPQEQHGLGLLMAEAIFALEGARCLSLGVQTPIIDIIRAAAVQQADIVALSFSSAMHANQVLDGLRDLRAGLPDATEIWVGGAALALGRCQPRLATRLELNEITGAMDGWRQRHGHSTAAPKAL